MKFTSKFFAPNIKSNVEYNKVSNILHPNYFIFLISKLVFFFFT